ncbi:MAG: hypothetical protein KME16_02525 [Scytolyngbya sp. HA4215-MV1]|jgi:hypothetical protein|nr:hypothetical protein [Scytolyngbya sp. HA4215-MV1]
MVSFVIAIVYTLFISSIKIVDSYLFNMNQYTGLLTILLIGIGLGIMGSLQHGRNHLFAHLGLVIHSAFLVTTLYEMYDRFHSSP